MECHSNIHLDFDAFLRSIKQNIDSPFGVLLGAGASISSGVQSANDCIWDWKASIYNTQSGIHQRLADPKKSNRSTPVHLEPMFSITNIETPSYGGGTTDSS